jgi:hypothetical protein
MAGRYDWASNIHAKEGTDMANQPVRGRLLPALTLAMLLTGCAVKLPTLSEPPPPPREPTPAEKGLKPMSGNEVRAILNKARYRWQAAQGATGTAITSGDGRVRVIWETGAANGRIRFTDTGYCSRFEGVRNGIEDCYQLYRTGRRDFTVVRQDGTPSGTIALLE